MNYPEFIQGNSVRWEVHWSQFCNIPPSPRKSSNHSHQRRWYGDGGEAEAVSGKTDFVRIHYMSFLAPTEQLILWVLDDTDD